MIDIKRTRDLAAEARAERPPPAWVATFDALEAILRGLRSEAECERRRPEFGRLYHECRGMALDRWRKRGVPPAMAEAIGRLVGIVNSRSTGLLFWDSGAYPYAQRIGHAVRLLREFLPGCPQEHPVRKLVVFPCLIVPSTIDLDVS